MVRAEALLERLRAIYCRHRALRYEEYDILVEREAITFGEVFELVEVLMTELNSSTGLWDFLFREEAVRREALKEERRGMGQAIRSARMFADAAGQAGDEVQRVAYERTAKALMERSREIRRELGDD